MFLVWQIAVAEASLYWNGIQTLETRVRLSTSAPGKNPAYAEAAL
jgi:hypothetical protein